MQDRPMHEPPPMHEPHATQVQHGQGSLFDRIVTTLVFLLLMAHLIIGSGEMIHGRMLNWGEALFGDPAKGIQYSYLRADPVKPDCDRNANIDLLVQQKMNEKSDDGFDDLFNEAKDPNAIRQSLVAAQQVCADKYAFYDQVNQHITPSLRAYRTMEEVFAFIFQWAADHRPLLLVSMVALAGMVTSLRMHHIALRPPHTRIDYLVYNIAMLMASVLMVVSLYYWFVMQRNSGIAVDPIIRHCYQLWSVLFTFVAGYSAYRLVKQPANLRPGGSFISSLASIPLFAWMAILSGLYFFSQSSQASSAIYIGGMLEYANLFLSLTLYIWVGMLLKQTRLVEYLLGILRPWNLSPETLTWFIMIGAAYLTAYTGASGIFVISAGAIIYREVLAAGARRQYALAATAMSGSLGVVLRPCLLIVLIAAMNKDVSTDELYRSGFHVFLLTSTLFLILSLFLAKEKFRVSSPSVAIPNMFRASLALIPFILVAIVVLVFYRYGLNTKMDETNAALILPLIMLGMVYMDFKLRTPGSAVGARLGIPADQPVRAVMELPHHQVTGHEPAPLETREALAQPQQAFDAVTAPTLAGPKRTIWTWLWNATDETIGHIGALILLMALSFSMGGLIEKSEVMSIFPSQFANPWTAMTFLMIAKVLIGMIMDPFGAVLLVSATLAPIAKANGIDPVHFWMMVLTAFELGYLLPPVALNQLLLRQVVGEQVIDEADAEVKGQSFFKRYERWILPLIVMFISLLVVSYGPLLWHGKP